MREQTENPIPISVRANSLLDQMPFLRIDPNTPKDHPNNVRRAVVRGIVLPFAYFLLENTGVSPDTHVALRKMQTPEEIVAAIVTHPGVGLKAERQQALLSEFGPGGQRDWGMIGFAITMQDNHPLSQLSLQIKDKISLKTREELTKAELSSY